jgi:hypothetical protein
MQHIVFSASWVTILFRFLRRVLSLTGFAVRNSQNWSYHGTILVAMAILPQID